MSPAVSEMLRRLAYFKDEAEKRRCAYKDMRLSRDEWRSKAIEYRKGRYAALRRAKEQHARAEFWRHRAELWRPQDMKKEDAA